jgi:signal transduction histidine kinase
MACKTSSGAECFNILLCCTLAQGDRQPLATNLEEIRKTTQEALGEMRLLLLELRPPPLLQELGLAATLRIDSSLGAGTAFRQACRGDHAMAL